MGVLDEILNLIESVSEGFPSSNMRFIHVRSVLFSQPTMQVPTAHAHSKTWKRKCAVFSFAFNIFAL